MKKISAHPLSSNNIAKLSLSQMIFYFQTDKYNTVTPFKFAAIKVRGFEIMTYSQPFNFAVSYQNYFTVSYTMYTNVVVFLHKLK